MVLSNGTMAGPTSSKMDNTGGSMTEDLPLTDPPDPSPDPLDPGGLGVPKSDLSCQMVRSMF